MSEKQNEVKDLGAISAYAIAVENGYAGTEEEFGEYLAMAAEKAEQTVEKAVEAAQSATDADASALVSEGYAVGTQDGVAVPSTSPYYGNNAKYYAEITQASVSLGSYIEFGIDSDGYVVMDKYGTNNNFDFEIDESGYLVLTDAEVV